MEDLKLNEKGFTLIELLIATLIMLIVSLGILRGIFEYEKFSIRGKIKNLSTQILEQMTTEIAKTPYPANNQQSLLYSTTWTNSKCDNNCENKTNCCDFENDDSDGDGLPDFYDPYSGEGDLLHPLSGLSSDLRLYPSSDTPDSKCSCVGSNCPSTNDLPSCTFKGYSGRNIYVAVNVADVKDPEVKAASVIVWYFEPFTNKFQHISSVVFRSK